MENISFFIGSLEVANLFISAFIIYFAFQFLKKSNQHRDRLPWEMLIFAAGIFFVSEILAFVRLIYQVEIPGLRPFLQTLFAALLLLAFTHQHHMIHHQEGIHIHKKITSKKQ